MVTTLGANWAAVSAMLIRAVEAGGVAADGPVRDGEPGTLQPVRVTSRTRPAAAANGRWRDMIQLLSWSAGLAVDPSCWSCRCAAVAGPGCARRPAGAAVSGGSVPVVPVRRLAITLTTSTAA